MGTSTGGFCFRAVSPKHFALAIVVALVLAGLLFTSFLANPHGPLDSLRSYLPWLHRASGRSPHIHPWYFYFERLFWFQRPRGPLWTEGTVLLLAFAGAWTAFGRRAIQGIHGGFVRWLVFYTLLLTAAYSMIGYKTPWCALGFYHGWLLLAGVGAAALWQWTPAGARRLALALALTAAGAHLGWQAWRASFPFAANPNNPYVYAQTAPHLRDLVKRVEAIAQAHPQKRHLLLKVMVPEHDYWPLPWSLRAFDQVGWYDRPPADPYAPIVIADARLQAALDEKSGKRYLMAGLYELRPRVFLELYVEFDWWRRYLESRPKPAPRE